MPDLPFTLTQNLATALAEVAGIEPDASDPVVVLAAYVDALAKEYGLSESLSIDVDPCGRTQQIEPVMEIVNHYLTPAATNVGTALNGGGPLSGGTPAPAPSLGRLIPDADVVRDLLYRAVAALAGDPTSRKAVHRSRPLSDAALLHLAQVYWNLEATPERPRLPIKPAGGRDIPVPDIVNGDFALMRWTDRVNQKGSYKSSGNSFRTQGARLAVLVARHLAAQKAPAPSPSRELEMRPTTDLTQPLEISLKGLVEKAVQDGEMDDAHALSHSYLDIIKRRAESNPLEMEPDLAEAYLVRGFTSVREMGDLWTGRQIEIGQNTVEDLKKAAASYQTLSHLHPDDDDLRTHFFLATILLCDALTAAGRTAEAVQHSMRYLADADARAAAEPADMARLAEVSHSLKRLADHLTEAGRHGEAVAATRRRVTVAERLVAAPPEAARWPLGVVIDWSLYLQEALHALGRSLVEVEMLDEAEQLFRRVLVSCETAGTDGSLPHQTLFWLSETFKIAGRVEAAAEALDDMLRKQPAYGAAHLRGVLFVRLSDLYLEADQPARCARAAMEAVKLLHDYVEDNPHDNVADMAFDRALLNVMEIAGPAAAHPGLEQLMRQLSDLLEQRRRTRAGTDDGSSADDGPGSVDPAP